MIAIHRAAGELSNRMISYCEENDIPFKIVNSYGTDIIDQLSGCNGFIWQFYQGNGKDYLMAKPLMNALEQTGIKTFPDFNTSWHFDDKVGQKYLLERIGSNFTPTWVFYEKNEAYKWIEKTEFPKVFKLRGGAGSQNVKLVRNKKAAKKLIRKAFSRGFPAYDSFGSIKERWRLLRLGKTNIINLLVGFARIFYPPRYAKIRGREIGYVYFQEFIKNNDSDIRVVIIKDKAFAIKRMVREDDFRASGSGNILYEKELIDEKIVKIAFEVSDKLNCQVVAFDFVNDNATPLIVEISYGFSPEGYDQCPGYWDRNMNWYQESFNPYGWMVENLLESINK